MAETVLHQEEDDVFSSKRSALDGVDGMGNDKPWTA